jgi:PKD repeat protein
MPDTHGYEVIAELTQAVLQQILEGAWDNSIIPHSVDIDPDLAFGPLKTEDGVVNIPKAGLALDMAPADNSVRITLPAEIHVEIANPPIPSASMFDMTADIFVTAPIGTLGTTINVGVLLEGLGRDKVEVTLTSGDPIGPITLTLIQEYVHEKYEDGTIPATIAQEGASLGALTADAFVEIFDDASDPNHQITVSQPAPNQVKLRIPIHLRLSNLSMGVSPMGVEAKIAITAPLVTAPGSISAQLTAATVEVEDFIPAPGVEGTNYNLNQAGASARGIDLEDLLKTEIRSRGQGIANTIGDINVFVPTVSQIEDFIGDQAHAALISRGNISLWTPETPGSEVTVNDVTIKVLADALAICINAGPGADPNGVTNFIPDDRSCAIAIDGDKVLQIIDEAIHRPEDEGGFGPDFPDTPKTFDDVDGHAARLTSLNPTLTDGAIHISGNVTVIDAIAGSIDVDASFGVDVGLQWADNPDGTQMIEPFTIGEPDVDLSLLAWILSFLIGFITFGLVGGIIVLVVLIIVEGVATSIGGVIIRDEVSDQIRGIGAWPQTLEGIGTVTSRFENPIQIDPDGIMFPDAYLVTATFALTVDALARSNGPYTVDGGSPLQFTGGPDAPDTDYEWDFGDGNTAQGAIVWHTYADDGLYVAKLTTVVNQPGGVRTRHFALVRVRNVPPKVDAGPDMAVDEGQKVEYLATFTDPEWPDTHTAVFDFGDDSLPVEGVVTETNDPPQAQGTARAKHAYCDNGDYTITVKVRDDDGGIGTDTSRVTVRNVAPTIDAGDDMFAYRCTPITLVARFIDPGWCDTHIGFWNFGDCTPQHPATIRERHEPPAGTGIAAATHVYDRCGTYLAECTVVDDDGGVGRDTIAVRVIDVLNQDFEGGFRNRLVGTVANEWEPYIPGGYMSGGAAVLAAGLVEAGQAMLFRAEEFVVHGGQRSQRIGGAGQFQAGIYQQVGANLNWDYQVSVWYHLDERGGGVCRLGIDPTGGTNPESADVQWSEGNEHRDWAQLVGRVTAQSRAITIFLQVDAEAGGIAYFDDVALIPYPCPLVEPEVPEPPPPEGREACVDWKDEQEARDVGSVYEKGGFTFQAISQESLRIVLWGSPEGQGKLALPQSGVRVLLPFVADRVVAHVVHYTGEPIAMEAFDATGQVGGASTTTAEGVLQTLEVSAVGITTLLFTGGGGEGLLIKLCAYQEAGGGDEQVQ